MSTTSFIKRHIFRLPLDKIFTTREFLLYGSRTSVDQALSKLVKKELIVRLARGVFVKCHSDLEKISVADVAKAKAEAFGKQISAWGGNLAVKLGLIPEGELQHIYCVNASSSKFKFGEITIHFRKACPRRTRFSDASSAGTFLGALWHVGRQQLGSTQSRHRWLPWTLNRIDKEEVRMSLNWLPSWLSSIFLSWTLPRIAFMISP